jgi:Asp-tRNA(Asn)/Glu-tRNA(Gln) amidotransferase B subunit
MDHPKINLALDLDSLFVEAPELDGDPVDVRSLMRNAVVQEAARQLLASGDTDWHRDAREAANRLRNELVREGIATEVEAAFNAPVQRTTRWGEKLGEPTTVRELIRLELEAFLNGTQTHRRHDAYDKTPNNLCELIGSVANETMTGELGQAVREARKQVQKVVQEIIAKNVAAELAKPR